MSANAAAAAKLKRYRWPKSAIGRFVAAHSMRGAAFWALVFGGLVASKSTGYATVYPTEAERAKLAASIGNNVGLNALFGTPHHLDSIKGYTAWYTLATMVIMGSIWAYLLATKTLRGEEQAGRWELMLAGQTTARRAAVNALAGLTCTLVVMYVIVAAVFVGIGRLHTVHYSTSAGLFLALAAVSSAAMFMFIGAAAAELMPTRARAAMFTTLIFGACFLVRAAADTTSLHWLRDITPLGWAENMQPLYGSRPLWLIPVFVLTLLAGGLTIFLAGRRDLGDSTFADKDTAKPHYGLLNSPLAMAVRLTRTTTIGWLAGITVMAGFFGLLTKSAANSFAQSAVSQKLDRFAHVSQTVGALTFMGIIFFVLMTVMMAYVANAVGAMREDEAEGYLDNLLARKVSRLQWLWGRVGLIVVGIVVAGLLSGLATWVCVANQNLGVTFSKLMLAGINAMAPAALTLGLGVFAIGFLPRLTSVIAYGAIAWSFLINIVSAGINLNHWIVDTSILNNLAFAPAADPKWKPVVILVALGAVLALLGTWRFAHRDLEVE